MSLVTPILVQDANSPAQGIMVDVHHISTPIRREDGTVEVVHEQLCGVCWNDARNPAIQYHAPDQLVWLDIPDFTDDPEDDGEEEGEEGEAGDEPEVTDEDAATHSIS